MNPGEKHADQVSIIVNFDPRRPEAVFEQLDTLGIDILKQMKFATLDKVNAVLDSVERAKSQMRARLVTLAAPGLTRQRPGPDASNQ